jgi:hypothetical protein
MNLCACRTRSRRPCANIQRQSRGRGQHSQFCGSALEYTEDLKRCTANKDKGLVVSFPSMIFFSRETGGNKGTSPLSVETPSAAVQCLPRRLGQRHDPRFDNWRRKPVRPHPAGISTNVIARNGTTAVSFDSAIRRAVRRGN